MAWPFQLADLRNVRRPFAIVTGAGAFPFRPLGWRRDTGPHITLPELPGSKVDKEIKYTPFIHAES